MSEKILNKENAEFGGGVRKNLKNYGNVEFVPIIEARNDGQDTVILQKVPPPPLHLKLGAVNALMKILQWLDPEGFIKGICNSTAHSQRELSRAKL